MATSRKEPVKHTCPQIDSVISDLNEVIAEIEEAVEYDADQFDDIHDYLVSWKKTINAIAYGNDCTLEQLRDANGALKSRY
jgi:hypothetical protein